MGRLAIRSNGSAAAVAAGCETQCSSAENAQPDRTARWRNGRLAMAESTSARKGRRRASGSRNSPARTKTRGSGHLRLDGPGQQERRSPACCRSRRSGRRRTIATARWPAAPWDIIGDLSVVPDLVQLTYHYDRETRLWAQISLVRLTGENFGRDVAAWRQWWEKQGGKPPIAAETVAWATSPENAQAGRSKNNGRDRSASCPVKARSLHPEQEAKAQDRMGRDSERYSPQNCSEMESLNRSRRTELGNRSGPESHENVGQTRSTRRRTVWADACLPLPK